MEQATAELIGAGLRNPEVQGLRFDLWAHDLIESARNRVLSDVAWNNGTWQGPWWLLHGLASIGSYGLGGYAAQLVAEAAKSLPRAALAQEPGGLLSGNAPLRGRASLDMTVHTLDYRLAAEFWGLRDPRLAFLVYAVAGGTPAYRTEMIRYDAPRDQADFDDWVARAILSPGSPMFMEARYLLAEEPGLRDPALYHSVLAAIAEGNTMRGAIANHIGRKTNDLGHPLNVLEDSGLIRRESDAFQANRSHFQISEPLLSFYHVMMRPFWPQLTRAVGTERVWKRERQRFSANILGPRFEELCREWVLRFAGDRFGGWPAQVSPGIVNDPKLKKTQQVDVAVAGHAEKGQPPLLALGEAKWNEVMSITHLERLIRVRNLVAGLEKYDTTRTRLVCFSGAGFTPSLSAAAANGKVDLIGLNDLYAANG